MLKILRIILYDLLILFFLVILIIFLFKLVSIFICAVINYKILSFDVDNDFGLLLGCWVFLSSLLLSFILHLILSHINTILINLFYTFFGNISGFHYILIIYNSKGTFSLKIFLLFCICFRFMLLWLFFGIWLMYLGG